MESLLNYKLSEYHLLLEIRCNEGDVVECLKFNISYSLKHAECFGTYVIFM